MAKTAQEKVTSAKLACRFSPPDFLDKPSKPAANGYPKNTAEADVRFLKLLPALNRFL